ncbi:MAG: hypothetical protein V7727_05505 [Sneathiella sp.]
MNVGSANNTQMMAQMRQMHQNVQQLRQDADTDGSSGLNVDEFTALREQVSEVTGRTSNVSNIEETFSTIDADGSGELSKAELKSHHQTMMEQRGGPGGPPPGGHPPPGGQPPGAMMSSDMQSMLLLLQEAGTDENGEFSVETLVSSITAESEAAEETEEGTVADLISSEATDESEETDDSSIVELLASDTEDTEETEETDSSASILDVLTDEEEAQAA